MNDVTFFYIIGVISGFITGFFISQIIYSKKLKEHYKDMLFFDKEIKKMKRDVDGLKKNSL